ncbi:MAG: glycosyltransferase family 2 protein [Propionibacteriales bacterium]|nr:glycosyltransferase family 2 protein [Propionibacteriales bacterium]
MTVRASVIIPCHNKPTTLPLTVDTVLRQSVPDLEVLLLGDGVTDEVREVAEALVRQDPRVLFLDFPKGPHHGEAYRHDAVMAARSDAIFYLCDDDLLLPDHVADLLALLDDATLVQSLNGYIRPDGSFRTYASDLADPISVEPILDERVQFNSISITGTAHRRSFYLEAGEHWETTPPGQWPDHHQFRRMMRHPSFRGATSHRMTALQLPTSGDGRETWSDSERQAELARWHEVVIAPGGQLVIDDLLHRGALAELAEARPQLARLSALIAEQQSLIDALNRETSHRAEITGALEAEAEVLRRRVGRLRRRRRKLRAELDGLYASRSWRVTAPLRRLGRGRAESG